MKELLKELGFKHLPMLSEFNLKVIYEKVIMGDLTITETRLSFIKDYTEFIAQPLTKVYTKEYELVGRFGDIIEVDDIERYCYKNMYYTIEHFQFDGGKIYIL